MHTRWREAGLCSLLALAVTCAAGCVGTVRQTTTPRTAKEQLLTSTAAKRAIARIDARKIAGRTVYVDVAGLHSIDRGYVSSAFDEMVALAGGCVVRQREDADIIVEARVAGLATYDASWTLWVPIVYLLGITGEPIASPDLLPIGYVLHEGWARIRAFAYERRTGKYVFGWGRWGYAHEGFTSDIYPEASIAESLKERVE